MCIIVDTNRLDVFLSGQDNEDVKPIYDWLNNRSGKIVYSTGAKFNEEVKKSKRRALSELLSSGKARFVSGEELESERQRLIEDSDHRSDDIHVLALALVSGARLLYTEDQALRSDFRKGKWKNGKFIIGNPRGRLYSGRRNSNLLTADVCNG